MAKRHRLTVKTTIAEGEEEADGDRPLADRQLARARGVRSVRHPLRGILTPTRIP
jgi:hypothetical protein